MGTIPADFCVDEKMLRIGGRPADALVAEAGDTPLFVYDFDIVASRIRRFRNAFGDVQLHYAIKANTYPPLLTQITKLVDGLDVASGGEMVSAMEAGAGADHISFAGPGKRDDELEAAISAGVTLNCESQGEVERAISIGRRLGRTPRLAVRVNPDFEIKGSGMRMGGGAKPFGVDAERVPALVRTILDQDAEWRGFHIFAGSQALDADALIEAQRATLLLAAKLSEEVGAAPPLVNLGGGFGIPYFGGEQPLDVEKVAAALNEGLERRHDRLRGTRFAIELGRWLVGEAGVYLTRIVDRKTSHGKIFLVTDGGMHHQLAASGNFGQVVRRNYASAIATQLNAPAEEETSIVGCLCTPLDRLADDVMLPKAGPGDLVALFRAGAYGLSASPQAFLGHPPAREMLVGKGL
ncbi:pyridoxal-dependent decarboxylase, exosortase A system-associated [Sphingosinicella rhizophila]|uniref:Pyridoxal-dependent decarboxylase, exosortase A system-associated n=1 Tax=Sphingosinicella rhizophila TaxID=3050082 RepID=A0ABU3Q378_9SPHN|nr:pyridoxal-dependent decarboxylase, exosortase A system-associated [Sphingosinicella sp. GR2756]MDT9597762.1 pyridoxal-dependent decarboxylase, exosortase A system-associated [Sphingosinicella sp. GR2756]